MGAAPPAAHDHVDANGMARRHGDGWRLPGIANLHSHAFQRAMAGLAERRSEAGRDSFWTWRETMYAVAARFDPDSLHAVASQLYVEMLEAGYTTVCEFHYLHHAPDGGAYSDPAAMSQALLQAARDTGIRLTLLPVLYMSGGFDGQPLGARQRRFGHDVDGYLRLCAELRTHEDARLRVGCALHSLRAVPPEAIAEVVAAVPADARLHLHVAEQVAEVDACLAARGARPVQWLLDNVAVDDRWTLVHATHLDDAEVRGIAATGATVALCPTTEANLGDGLFPFPSYLEAGGSWGIGSDSHVSVSPVEELRWLEYGQRLALRQRNVSTGPGTPSVGDTLLRGAWASAAAATGFADAGDHLLLDALAPQLVGATADDVADRWLFSGNRNLVSSVVVDGDVLVAEGRHRARDAIAERYRRVAGPLLAGVRA